MMNNSLVRAGLAQGKTIRLAVCGIAVLMCWLNPATLSAASTITYVQGNNSDPQASNTSVKVTYTAAQVAGDLNVIAVGWNDSTATVSTVTDTTGNVYTRAVGPTVISGLESQSIYYAKNIAAATAGANSVTVTFSAAAAFPDIRILEYSGADPNNPVDVTAAASGNSATSSSGAVTTTNSTDLLFGANMVQTSTTGPGTGFASRMLTSPDGDIAEDEMVTATGSYSATAPLTSGQWIMQMAAFRTPAGGTGAPTVSSVSPNSGSTAGGTAVTITGTNFATGATVTFGTAAATNVAVVNSTTVAATTPAGSAGAVTVTVTVSGQSGSLASGFTYALAPTVTSVSPNSGSTLGGTAVTITGTNFAAGATVTFGATAATSVVVVSSTSITTTTPAGSAGAVTVTVTVGGQSGSLTSGFTYAVFPTVSSVSPIGGPTAGGTAVTITGTSFATGATVTFGATAATNVVVVSSTSITATSPAGSPGAVTVTVTVSGHSGSLANGFTYTVAPTVTAVSPNSGSTAGGTAVTITGTNFATGATVTVGGAAATSVVVVSGTQITATTPAGSAGAVTVTVTNLGAQSGSLASAFTYVTSGTPSAPTNLTVAAGGPGPTYVSGQGYYNTTSLTTHTTASFNSTGGDLVLLFASSHAGVAFTPSDSLGNTWIPIAGPTSTVLGFDLRSQVWYAPHPTVGAAQTVTMNLSIAQPLVMSIVVVKGSNGSSPINAISLVGSDNGTSSINVISPSITTTGTNDLLVGFVKTNGTETFTAGPGFTLQAATTVLNLTGETELEAAAGTYDATFTLSTGVTWQSVVGAVNNNPNQTTLSWTSSTEAGGTISQYLVERCQGAGCTSFAQIGTSTTTTYNDTGLTASTSYSYRVRAEDTASNLGPYSSVVTAATAAPIPSLPGNLTATVASGTQVNLAWVASSETGGTVSSYLVQRCQGAGCTNFAQVGTSATNTYNDTGLATGNSYSYRVQASDTAGGLSPFSNVVSATPGPSTAPSGLTATAASMVQINLSWTASTSSVGLANYIVQRCQGAGCTNFAQVASFAATTTTYSDTGLAAGTSYSYQVQASDTAGGLSPFSNVATATTLSSATAITYVQGAYTTPQSSVTTASVAFTAAQAAGDLNVVVVGWNNSTATVSSVTDTSHNTYTLAVGPTIQSGVATQSIYFAKNIVAAGAGANSVTVTFSAAAAEPDIRILEYTGADPNNPVDVTAASSGSSATSSSGSATTTNATDLIFGANLVQTTTTGPGTGFTSRMLTSPDGDIAEDEMVTATGSYSATAPLTSGQWITQMVAFRTPSAGSTAPTVSSVSPNTGSTAGGTAVTITGTNFATGATVTFGTAAATNVVVVSATQITATTPAGAAGAVTVTVTVSTKSGSLTNAFTYVIPPTVTSVSPNTGSTGGGTAVTITGTNFATGATVTFGTAAATNVVAVSSTSITATAPAGSAGAVTVTVTVSGVSGSLASGFTYAVIPAVTSVSPNTGSTAGGTAVTITGTNFATGATVTFGAAAATNVVVVSATQITATTPAGSAGALTVTVTVNGQSGSLASGFTYALPPTVTSVSPNTGSTLGGTAVTITGANFAAGATVTFGSTAATSVVVVSSTSITATTPAGSAGAVTVTVTVGGQSGSLATGFTYAAFPTVTSVSPNSGPTAGGTAVTITGTNFATGAAVTFGATAATNVVVVSATQITATTPAGTAGAVTVTVTVNGHSGSLASGFTYSAPPTVTGISPNSGLTAGGTAVTITGTSFATGATVTFGATAATNVVIVSATQITATTPAGSAGAVTVTVTVGGQSGSLAAGYTYVLATMISFVQGNSATPQSSQTSVPVTFTSAQTAGHLNVVVVGWNDSAATVTSVTDTSHNTYTLAVGPTIQSGVAAQSIYYAKNILGAAAGANVVTVTFSVAAGYPDIRVLEYTGADPNAPVDVTAASSGSSATSSSGAVTTTNATDLLFGANLVQTATTGPGTGFTSRLLTVPDADIAEDEMVTAVGSYSATAPINSGQWIMQMVAFRTPTVPPTVTSVSPNSGTNLGGTAVTITGANFAAGATVTVGATAATNVVVVSATQITATTPVGIAGPATVTVTVNQQSGSLASGFTYVLIPTVTSVLPNSGATVGGTAVTITGTNFASGASVTFGGTAATNVAVASATQLTATAPAGTAGAVTVTVTVAGQSGSLASGFTYLIIPTVTSVSPSGGPTAGGTAVTITGTNYAVGATVTFGATAATNVVVVGATQITATAPVGSAGPVTVTVTSGGQSGSLASGYIYTLPPTVTAVSPNNGPTGGETPVTITGTNFATGATVTVGGTAATSVVVVSGTQITATTPAGSAGAATVTVTNLGVPSGSLASAFTYVVTPTAPTGLTVAGGGPGPTYVSGQGYYSDPFLTAHTTAPFDSTGGDLILVFASCHNGVTFTPSDSFGNTWISIAGPTNTAVGSDLRSQVWYAPHPTVGAGQTVTMSVSIAQPLVMSVIVVKGSNTSSPIDAISLIGADNGTNSDNIVSPSLTTTSANDLLVGFVKTYGVEDFTAGLGFTLQSAATVLNLTAETGAAATPGSYDATFTTSVHGSWQSVIGAVTNNPNQTTLSWTASTETGGGTISQYLVERCQGAGCSSFAQIGTSTTTTYNDTGLTASTSYSYRVRAEDTVSVLGPYSSVFTLTTPAQIPSLPGNLTATAASTTQMNLAWVPSTETGGTVGSYLVQRCQGAGCTNFAQIGTSATATYSDTNLSATTSYRYRVQASDTAANLGPFSNLATTTTLGPPTAPANLTAAAASMVQISLNWTASATGVGLANYIVQRCQGTGCTNFVQVASFPAATNAVPPIPVTTYTDTGLAGGTTYSYQIQSSDTNAALSPFSNGATATTLSSATAINYVQGAYSVPQSPQTIVTVGFTAAQAAGDLNVVVVGWSDSTATVSSVTDKSGNTYTLAVGPTIQSGVASQSIYYAQNIAAAAAGANSVTVTFSVAALYPDIRILEYTGADPNNPVDVTAASSGSSATSSSTATTTSAADLIFGANLVQGGTLSSGTGFTTRLLTVPDADIAEDEMVTAVGSYSATANLNSGQWIMQMVAFRLVTCSGGAPSAPTNLTATATGVGQINLSWNPSISCPGIAHYVVQRCQGASCTSFAQVGTPAGTTFSDTGLASNTSFSYQVQAVDNNSNSGPFSSVASATTLALSISPRTTALTFTRTQQFTSAGSASVTWSVDGATGGSATSGTITTSGLYTPPNTDGTHTVTVTTSNQLYSASATVYITNYPGTFTYHNDNLRTGQNLSETVLALSNVNQNQFGKLFSYPIDGMAFASPLYVANVSIPGQGYHNVVYVATENDSVYAFDADGLSTTPLWHVSFLKSGVTTIPCADTGECGDILTQIGITSTPVIDQTGGTIYVVAATKEGTSTWVQRLHALDITTGAEKFGGPVVLQASLPGTGSGSSGGNVAFDPLRENQRAGLLLNGGVLYIAFGSHGDNSPWHGWVLGYNSTTLLQTMMYDTTPNGNGGGIWQGGGGLATDATGDIYYVTSNGNFDVNTGGVDYGDSVQKLSPTGTVVDYFTPHDQQNMDVNNLDLGAGGPVMLVDQTTGSYPHLLITAGKSGTIYVINRDSLGHYNASNDNQIVQSLVSVLPNGTVESGNFSTPVFFNGYVYFGAVNDVIRAFQLTNGLLSTTPTSQSAAIYGVRGASFAVSANTTSNGILWALQNNGASADNDVGNPGVLFAYNADNLAIELYDSSQAGSRDTLDNAVKFAIPLVANGKVFVAGQTQLTAFGLLP